MKTLIALLFTCALLVAQGPFPPNVIPSANWIGGSCLSQPGGNGVVGAMVANCYCAPFWRGGDMYNDVAGENSIRAFGTLAFCTSTVQSGLGEYPSGSYVPFMIYKLYNTNPIGAVPSVTSVPASTAFGSLLPWEPNHSSIAFPNSIGTLNDVVIVTPGYYITYTNSVYNYDWDFWIYTVGIPNNSALLGCLFHTQWGRIDQYTGNTWFSNDHHVRINP